MKTLSNFRMMLLSGALIFAIHAHSQDPNFYIFVCFGQSNMEGQGDIEPQDRVVDERLQVLQAVNCTNIGRTDSTWYPAIPPLTRCWSRVSPADYFGRTMVANLPDSISVGIVNVSVAGCKIELYDKHNFQDYVDDINPATEQYLIDIINEYNGNPYQYLVNTARRAQQDGVIKGILLHQGESNTGDAQWPAKVKTVYDTLLADLGLDAASVPLLAGEVVHADQGGFCASMNAIIGTLPATVPTAHVISSSGCTDQADNIHFNTAGYREMGRRYAIKMLELMGIEMTEGIGTAAIYLETECATMGDNIDILEDGVASNGAYVAVKEDMASAGEPADSADIVYIPFSVDSTGPYQLYARVKFRSLSTNAIWVQMDDHGFFQFEGQVTGNWQWLFLAAGELEEGEHTVSVAFTEEDAKIDKLLIGNYLYAPSDAGSEADNLCAIEFPDAINTEVQQTGFFLGQNHPNPFNDKTTIAFEIPYAAFVSLKVYNMLGEEVCELAGREYPQGKHTADFRTSNLASGTYYYVMNTSGFSARKMMSLKGR